MNIKFIIIVLGEPYSTFSEILGKYFNINKKLKKKIVLIGNSDLFRKQLKKLNYHLPLNDIDHVNNARKSKINILNIKFAQKKIFSKISKKSNSYIKESFDKSLEILKQLKDQSVLVNGPVSKKYFLEKKFSGITEFLSKKTKSKNEIMLIYNEKLSVSPLSTHIPIKYVTKKISKEKLTKSILKIREFYKSLLKKNVRIAILGLNPHCETTDKFSEEEKIIMPAIKYFKKRKINVDGPFPADTFFLRKNMNKYDVVIGMYHDQVLTPIKTIFKFNAINITIGLPFIRISPDHGPNSKMLGKNLSDPSSFNYAMKFINKLK